MLESYKKYFFRISNIQKLFSSIEKNGARKPIIFSSVIDSIAEIDFSRSVIISFLFTLRKSICEKV